MRGVLSFFAIALAGMVHAAPVLVLNVDTEATGEGVIEINLRDDLAPLHVERIVSLANAGAYDGVVFHRVIDGFMAQTGDVAFGKIDGDISRAGTGGSDMPDLPAEFSNERFSRGVVGMARSQDPNSANSQFFIMYQDAPHLDGQYTIIGEVREGMEIVDAIKKGKARQNGLVEDPDHIVSALIVEDEGANSLETENTDSAPKADTAE